MSNTAPWPRRRDEDQYGEDYLTWKHWAGAGEFGTCSSRDAYYFDAEIARTGLTSIRRVLELGFGNGTFLAYGRSRGWDMTGTEANPALIAAGKRAGYCAKSPREVDDLPENSFDLVAAFDVFEHLPPDTLTALLLQMRAKLVPGGALLARFPNGDSPFGLSNQNGDITHAHAIGSNKLRYFANASGFEVAYLGPEAYPVRTAEWKSTLYRCVMKPVRGLIDAAIKAIYFPGSEVYFTSPNLVTVMRKPRG